MQSRSLVYALLWSESVEDYFYVIVYEFKIHGVLTIKLHCQILIDVIDCSEERIVYEKEFVIRWGVCVRFLSYS